MSEQEDQESPVYQTEGPTYQDGLWAASITLPARKSATFYGKTKEEVSEQLLWFLGQQALEIEKARIQLRKAFEHKDEKEENKD